jgi:hypothetical protein
VKCIDTIKDASNASLVENLDTERMNVQTDPQTEEEKEVEVEEEVEEEAQALVEEDHLNQQQDINKTTTDTEVDRTLIRNK